MNLWWEHSLFQVKHTSNCSSYRTKGEEHSNLQSPSFSGISIPLLTSFVNLFFSSHANPNPNGKNEVLHMLGVLVSTVVSHLVTRNGRPIGQMKSEWGADTAKHWRYCILTTNYLISQTWRAGSFLSSELMNIWFIYGFEDRDEFAFKMIIVLNILSEALKQTECFFNFPFFFFFFQIFWFHISGPKNIYSGEKKHILHSNF